MTKPKVSKRLKSLSKRFERLEQMTERKPSPEPVELERYGYWDGGKLIPFTFYVLDWADATHEEIHKVIISEEGAFHEEKVGVLDTEDGIEYGVLCGDHSFLYTADTGSKVWKIDQESLAYSLLNVTQGTFATAIVQDSDYVYIAYQKEENPTEANRIVKIRKSDFTEVDYLVLSGTPIAYHTWELQVDTMENCLWVGSTYKKYEYGWWRYHPRIYKIDLATFTEVDSLDLPCPESDYCYGPIGALGFDAIYLYIAPYYNAFLRCTKSPLAYDTRLWQGFPEYPQFPRRWLIVSKGKFWTVFNNYVSESTTLKRIDCLSFTQEAGLSCPPPGIANALTVEGKTWYIISEEGRIYEIDEDSTPMVGTYKYAIPDFNFCPAAWSKGLWYKLFE